MKYSGNKLNCISFPLGGIGTGSIGLAGNGRLIDWEIRNRSAKGSYNRYSGFMIKAEDNGKLVDFRVLNGDQQTDLSGQYAKTTFTGFGHGPFPALLSGIPHFRDVTFKGEYPFAEICFSEAKFPGKVSMTAFNPFIPMNSADSSLPAAFFEIKVKNDSARKLDYTLAGSLSSLFNDPEIVRLENGCMFRSAKVAAESSEYGELAMLTDHGDISHIDRWYDGTNVISMNMFLNDFLSPGRLPVREYNPVQYQSTYTSTIAAHFTLKPGESRTVRYVISWYFPNVENFWNPPREEKDKHSWKNYYATQFSSSQDVASYSLENFSRLRDDSMRFKNALYSSTVPKVVVEAVSAAVSTLKTATCMRLENGEFYAFEGVHEESGSCEGTCSHVWNYTYAMPFLFPDLERSIRRLDFKYNKLENGGLGFRLQLPLGRAAAGRACLDGQAGAVFKTYREWKISGDNEFLRELWHDVKDALAFFWSESNPDFWDMKKSGVISGRQHNTLDIDLYGPNAWLTGMYLAALKAGAEMADAMGEPDTAKEYRVIFAKGRAYLNSKLYNGEYYIQDIDLADKSILKKTGAEHDFVGENGEIRFQIKNGCIIDQTLGQWHADLLSLGDIFEREKVKSALESIYKYNFKKSFRDYVNFHRIYALNDESGVVICSWPHNDMPKIPICYATESMHGFEYQFACQLLRNGMEDKALDVVRSIRDRYDGAKRNPWNEIEAGSNYARSMANYAFLNTYSGFEFDMTERRISFSPLARGKKKTFRCFFSICSGWGTCSETAKSSSIKLEYGTLELKKIGGLSGKVSSVRLNGRKLPFNQSGNVVFLDSAVKLEFGDVLTFCK